jgi:hypothetical protein
MKDLREQQRFAEDEGRLYARCECGQLIAYDARIKVNTKAAHIECAACLEKVRIRGYGEAKIARSKRRRRRK